MTSLPIIQTQKEIELNFPAFLAEGMQVQLIGTYAQVDVRMRCKDLPPPVYLGHVTINFPDGGGVYLYPIWHSQAIRLPEEIAKFENKQVIVIGRLVRRMPPQTPAANIIIAPCLLSIDSIRLEQEKPADIEYENDSFQVQNTSRDFYLEHQRERRRQKKRNKMQKNLWHQLLKLLKTVVISAKIH